MSESKMELGPLQKEWVKQLRENPEQQIKKALGLMVKGKKRYCCLGKACEVVGSGLWQGKNLFDQDTNEDSYMGNSFEMMGLHSEEGVLRNKIIKSKNGLTFVSLAVANDGDVTWPEIADFIESNPESVFSKSV